MRGRKDRTLILCGIVFTAIAICIGVYFSTQLSFAYRAARCNYANTAAETKTACWFTLLDQSMKKEGVAAMILSFYYIQNHYSNIFTAEDCHSNAHRMGDMLYAKLQLDGGDVATVDFPREATLCTFGVLHGLFMHLFADHPTTQFVTTTCSYFGKRFSNTFPTMEVQCYHAAGYGFALAYSKDTTDNPNRLAAKILEQCDNLPSLTYIKRQACYRGVFTTLFDWTAAKQHGLSFKMSEPYSFCETMPTAWKRMCYAGVADRFFREQELTVSTLAAHVAPITDPDLRAQAFRPAMYVLILRAMTDNSYISLVPECGKIPQDLFVACITLFPSSLFNAGFPDEQYKKAYSLCNSPEINSLNAEKLCYLSIAKQLARFYTDEELSQFDDPKVIDAIEKLRKTQKLTTTELDLPDVQ